MASHPYQRSAHPKISSMPRQKSEASIHLEIYKISVEKHRLQQELQNLKNRELRIKKRLEEIETQSQKLMSKVKSSEAREESSTEAKTEKESQFKAPKSAFDFEPVYVEY
ncbi:MAG: gas vesicle protein [Halothece sp.]